MTREIKVDQPVKKQELIQKLLEARKGAETINERREAAYQAYLKIAKETPPESVELRSIVNLDSERLAKIQVSVHSFSKDPWVTVDKEIWQIRRDGKRGTEQLDTWEAICSFPQELVYKLKEIDGLLEAWEKESIVWPWPILSPEDFHNYWEY